MSDQVKAFTFDVALDDIPQREFPHGGHLLICLDGANTLYEGAAIGETWIVYRTESDDRERDSLAAFYHQSDAVLFAEAKAKELNDE